MRKARIQQKEVRAGVEGRMIERTKARQQMERDCVVDVEIAAEIDRVVAAVLQTAVVVCDNRIEVAVDMECFVVIVVAMVVARLQMLAGQLLCA